MRLTHDRRFWTAVMAAAGLLLATAVAFATSGFPVPGETPALPSVVTARPVEASPPSPAATASPPAASTPGTRTAAAVLPAPAASVPRTSPRPAPPRVAPAAKPPTTRPDSREVVHPDVREESERPKAAPPSAATPLSALGYRSGRHPEVRAQGSEGVGTAAATNSASKHPRSEEAPCGSYSSRTRTGSPRS